MKSVIDFLTRYLLRLDFNAKDEAERSSEESFDFVDIGSDVPEDENKEKVTKGKKCWSELCTRTKLLYSEKKSRRVNWTKIVYSDSG